jgi:deoxyuridine 5'-triphosphate nucleotidohydrolase
MTESAHSVHHYRDTLSFLFEKDDAKIISNIVAKYNAVYNDDGIITISGSNMLDFLYTVKDLPNFSDAYKYYYADTTLKFIRHFPEAKIPSKVRGSDIGYDLTIVKEVKKLNSKTTMYDTGISLIIPVGYYVSIHPRSSLSKSGYILANSEGIIDTAYTGHLLVVLTKVVDDMPDLTLPFVGVQMVLKKAYYPQLVEVNENAHTTRASGSFGSTG